MPKIRGLIFHTLHIFKKLNGHRISTVFGPTFLGRCASGSGNALTGTAKNLSIGWRSAWFYPFCRTNVWIVQNFRMHVSTLQIIHIWSQDLHYFVWFSRSIVFLYPWKGDGSKRVKTPMKLAYLWRESTSIDPNYFYFHNFSYVPIVFPYSRYFPEILTMIFPWYFPQTPRKKNIKFPTGFLVHLPFSHRFSYVSYSS